MLFLRKARRFQALFLLSALTSLPVVCVSAEAQSDPLEAKSASVPAPRQLPPAETRAFAPPMSQDEASRRELDLGAHHRTIPIGDTPQAMMTRAMLPPPPQTAAPMAVATPLDSNRGLTDAETMNATSTVNEPSVATRGDEVLITGNWFAAFSTDAGQTFSYVNPDNTFPAASGGFCCDQVALYDGNHDVMFWFLQYIKDSQGENTVRLAVAQGADIAAQQWRYYDFTPVGVGGWNNEWFDYPDLAAGSDHLYITTNAFSAANSFTRSVVLRIPLAELAAYQPLNFDFWDTSQHGSLRLAQGATDTMYFASHNNASSIRVFAWPETSPTLSFSDVGVTGWPIAGARPGWTARSDHRITAGWFANGELGFGWTASAGSAGGATFAHPHARFAVIDVNTMNVAAEPHLWNQNFPFAYPSAAPNGAGRVGLGVHFGNNPNHAVGVLETAGGPPAWDLVTTADSTHSPSSNKWGDYAAVRVHGSDPDSWVATGFNLDGGTAMQDIVVRYLHFREPIVQPGPDQVTLQLEDPARKLKQGQSMWVRATATRNGVGMPNRTVTFSSSDPGKLTVSPATGLTDASGVAQADVTSQTSKRADVTVTADDNGVSDSGTVKVPDISVPGFLLLLLVMALAGLAYRGPSAS